MRPGTYQHTKGQLYEVTGTAIDATNGSEGDEYVIYYAHYDPKKIFVRRVEEFSRRFSKVSPNDAEHRSDDIVPASREETLARNNPPRERLVTTEGLNRSANRRLPPLIG